LTREREQEKNKEKGNATFKESGSVGFLTRKGENGTGETDLDKEGEGAARKGSEFYVHLKKGS